MNILLFGPPGAGKGTQSALLVDREKMFQISTGDLFRNAIKNSTTLGLEAKKYMDAGQLVPDSIVIGMVEEVLAGSKNKSFILDGFPRTVQQADALGNLLKGLKLSVDRAVFLDVPSSILLGRLTGRRVCQNCGASYHVEAKPPKKAGVCDLCGGAVILRNDDKEEVISARLAAYESSTAPLKAYYEKVGSLRIVNGMGSTEEVFSRIKAAMA